MKHKKISAYLLPVALVLAMSTFAQNAGNDEESVRAAIAVAMLRFTIWEEPEIAKNSRLQICSLGAPLSQSRLDQAIVKAPFFGKKLLHKKLDASSTIEQCEVLLLGPKTSRIFTADKLKNKLSICDGCVTGTQSAIAELLTIDDHIKFNINLVNASEANIKLSSDLLILANDIRREADVN